MKPSLIQNQPKSFSNALADSFVEKGLLSADQVAVAIQEQSIENISFEDCLINLGFMSETALAEALSQTSGFERIDLQKTLLDPSLKSLISKTIAEKYRFVPLSFEGKTLRIAIADIYNLSVFDHLKHTLPSIHQIIPLISPESDILEAIDDYYGYELSIPGLLKEIETISQKVTQHDTHTHPTVRLVNAILIDAIKLGASDIHFEPEGSFMRIRYRIDGILSQICTLHATYWPAICVRLKVMSEINIAESRRPQNGRMTFFVGPREIDLRVASHPTVHGENIVIRILDKTRSLMSLDELGYSENVIFHIKKALQKPEGLFIITGPTGCGKTTSLYSMLSYINTPHINIMTLEEPVEYKIPFIRQADVKDQTTLNFADGVRSILRQDPDIILIGEIRDGETAQMALRASMTGHQVFSTLHTNDALGSLPRLTDLGLSYSLLSGNILGIVAQRLVRKLCPNCKQEKETTPYEAILLKSKTSQKMFTARGCSLCRGTGYKGRLAIAEVVVFDTELDEALMTTSSRRTLKPLCIKKGYVSMQQDARSRVLNGDTSLEEISRVINIWEGS